MARMIERRRTERPFRTTRETGRGGGSRAGLGSDGSEMEGGRQP